MKNIALRIFLITCRFFESGSINNRKVIPDVIVRLLLVFYNSKYLNCFGGAILKNLNCFGALSFFTI